MTLAHLIFEIFAKSAVVAGLFFAAVAYTAHVSFRPKQKPLPLDWKQELVSVKSEVR